MIDAVSAVDEMRQLFLDGWQASDVLTPMPEIRWAGNEKDGIPAGFYVRFYHQILKSPQSAHMTDAGGGSKPIYDTSGLLFVQVYAPINAEDSERIGELLAQRARDIYRGVETNSGVWFRNARYNPEANDAQYYRFLVTVAFEFSEAS